MKNPVKEDLFQKCSIWFVSDGCVQRQKEKAEVAEVCRFG